MFPDQLNSPGKRGVAVALLTAAAIWTLRPAYFFSPRSGRPYVAVWALESDSADIDTTKFPWYGAVALLTAATVLFV